MSNPYPPLRPLELSLAEGCVLEASAGTGKTFTITTLYVRLLLEEELPLEQILVVTFGRAAAAELSTRLRARLVEVLRAYEGHSESAKDLAPLVQKRSAAGHGQRDQERLRAALLAFDEAAVHTIHGFCQRMLQELAFDASRPFGLELLAGEDHLVDQVIDDLWVSTTWDLSPLLLHTLVSRAKGRDGLRKLAKQALARPDGHFLPDPAPSLVDARAQATSAAASLRARLAGLSPGWDKGMGALCELLVSNKNMKGYGPATTPTWCAAVSRILAGGLGPELLWDESARTSLWRLSRRGLEDKRKEGAGECPAHPLLEEVDELIAELDATRALAAGWVLALRRDLVREVHARMSAVKRSLGQQSFSDLLVSLRDSLGGPQGPRMASALRARFPVVLIDEFQDTDEVQYEIFKTLYGSESGARALLIGDPKQAIYGFRSGDVFTYLKARDEVGERVFTLEQNWRSDPKLVAAVGHLFGRPRAFLDEDIRLPPVGAGLSIDRLGGTLEGKAPLRVHFVPSARYNAWLTRKGCLSAAWREAVLPQLAADEVARLLAAGITLKEDGGERPLGPGDIAVLCVRNEDARATQEALRLLRVPSVLLSGASVFYSPEAEELERLMRAMEAPGRGGMVRAALVTSVFGLSAEELLALESDERAWELHVEQFRRWRALWERQGLSRAFSALGDEVQLERRLLGLLDGERRLTNLGHLVELLQQTAVERRLGPAALLQWLAAARADEQAYASLGESAAQMRLESDERAVKLLTVHKSKGLQFPVVLCPFLWQKEQLLSDPEQAGLSFHDEAALHRLCVQLDAADPAWAAQVRVAEEETIGERLRLFYVAATRARHLCVLLWGNVSGATCSPLTWLLREDDGPWDAVELPDDAAVRGPLEALAARSEGTLVVEDLDDEPPHPWTAGAEASAPALRARGMPTLPWDAFRIASFTALKGSGAQERTDGKDRDPEEPAPPFVAPEEEGPKVPLHDFTRGAPAGLLVHHAFEHLDFQGASRSDVKAAVAGAQQAFSSVTVDDEMARKLSDMVAAVLDTPLPATGGSFRLGQVAAKDRLAEMGFVFPVAAEPGIDPNLLADALARHGEGPLGAPYAELVRRMDFKRFSGFLRGFIDLTLRHEGRWYVLDYKSNLLGRQVADYTPEKLTAAMTKSHYALQALLYVVATHRYLEQRQPGYSYEEHFGGVHCLFVRGMGAGSPDAGVWFHRFPAALVEELSRAFGRPEGGPA
jgi:exodeoxyribonuclease V beta subunit